jgi:RimJ/RimL family protein N-acetyltransferase
MNTNFWRGQKIRLRAVEQKDLDELMSSTEEPDTEIDRRNSEISFPTWREKDRDELAEVRQRKDGSFFWIIETLDGQTVGNIGTFDCDRRVGCFKYHIIVKRSLWGQGYGREAVMMVLRYYFRELRYQKCTIIIYSFNERSLRFHQKLGFQFEGRLRRVVYTNGNFYDEIYFGLTQEEFDQIDPKPELASTTKFALP